MIDFKNYERLTISKGEISFYDNVYNKCSNRNAPEVREKVENGTLFADIEEYKYCSYTTEQLSDIYTRLSQFEDLIEQGKLVVKIEPKTTLNKEQQIEEMLNIIDKHRNEGVLGTLYDAGYRKKEEIEKQVAKEILEEFWKIQYGQTKLDNVCIRLAEKYGLLKELQGE